MKMMAVRDARRAFASTNVDGFAAEMGISVSDAASVQAYISNHDDVSDDSIVVLDENVINGVKLGAGNVVL